MYQDLQGRTGSRNQGGETEKQRSFEMLIVLDQSFRSKLNECYDNPPAAPCYLRGIRYAVGWKLSKRIFQPSPPVTELPSTRRLVRVRVNHDCLTRRSGVNHIPYRYWYGTNINNFTVQ
jgi:hypothetical protein